MTSTTTTQYSLGASRHEYERVRAQALAWDTATAGVLDRIGVPRGARCLDVGCGPGEVMRLLAERVGPAGHVDGLDADPAMSAAALDRLHAAGHRQCDIRVHAVRGREPLPGGRYDVVYTRLLLFHLPDRVAVLARLWDAVAPGGCLIVQEYDVRPVSSLPELDSLDDVHHFVLDAFRAAGADPAIGSRLPRLFADAAIGPPDGTDVAGRSEPLARAQTMVLGVARSLLPAAVAAGVATVDSAERLFASVAADAARHPDAAVLWPLLMTAWRRRPAGEP